MEWYLGRAESGHFENPGLPTHGAGRNKTGWANEVARGWMAETRGDGARVYLSGQGGGEMGRMVRFCVRGMGMAGAGLCIS